MPKAKAPSRQTKTASQRTRKTSLLWSGSNLGGILNTLREPCWATGPCLTRRKSRCKRAFGRCLGAVIGLARLHPGHRGKDGHPAADLHGGERLVVDNPCKDGRKDGLESRHQAPRGAAMWRSAATMKMNGTS